MPKKPKTRDDCLDGPRPCPWVSCKYHLYLDVHPKTGALKLNFPHLEPWELEESCTLDLSNEVHTLEEVGEKMNVTRERIRQLESRALYRLKLNRSLKIIDPENDTD